MSEPIYLTSEIRRIEAAAKDLPLMQRAGAAAAELAARLSADTAKDVLVLAGPGNNGGDAKIVADILRQKFFRVTLAGAADAATLPVDKRWGLVVDGLFGIGLAREIDGDYAKLVTYANAQDCPVLALDIPSGIDSDTGRVLGHAVQGYPHDHLHRAQARPADAGRAGPLRRGLGRRSRAGRAQARAADRLDGGAAAVRRRAQAAAAEFPQGPGGLARDLRRRAGHDRRRAARGARRAQARRRPRLRRHAGRVVARSRHAGADAAPPRRRARPGPRRHRRRAGPGTERARGSAGRRGAGERHALRARRRRAEPGGGEPGPARRVRQAQGRHAAHAASGGSRRGCSA